MCWTRTKTTAIPDSAVAAAPSTSTYAPFSIADFWRNWRLQYNEAYTAPQKPVETVQYSTSTYANSDTFSPGTTGTATSTSKSYAVNFPWTSGWQSCPAAGTRIVTPDRFGRG